MSDEKDPKHESADAFEAEARRRGRSLVGEFVDFLRHNKKWWLIPVVVALLAVGVLILLGGTAAAPFIYTLF